MVAYQLIELALLKLARQGAGDTLGYPTSLPTLHAHIQADDKDIVDALRRLHPKYLTVWKWQVEESRHVEFNEKRDIGEFFYSRDFRLRSTPETGPRIQELEARLASTEADRRRKLTFSPLKAWFPTADKVLSADFQSLGETLLRHLKTYEGGGTVHQFSGGFNRAYYIGVMEGRNLGLGPLPTQPEYGLHQPKVSRRMQEAWNLAVARGLLMQNPDQPGQNWFILTTEGENLLAGPLTPPAEEKTLHSKQIASVNHPVKASRKVFVVHGHDEGARERLLASSSDWSLSRSSCTNRRIMVEP